MFRVLLKKQLFEVFRSWLFNPKTGKIRSKGGTIAMALLFLLLMVVLGGSFAAIAIGIAAPFCASDVGYLYFILFGLLAVALGLFGSVFNTYAGLYLARDNDLLLSLPIPTGVIVASRLFSTYLMGLLYAAVAFIPAMAVWQVVGGFDFSSLLGNLVMLLEISLLIWVLSCLLGFLVAKISLHLKHRSFVAVLAALLFIGLYYFVCFKAQAAIQDLVVHAAIYGAKVKGSAYILYLWGQNGAGKLPDMAICLVLCAALAALTWFILSRTFFRVAAAAPREKKSAPPKKAVRVNSIPHALLKKEFSRFTSSANYMLNCGLGAVFLSLLGIMLLIKGQAFVAALSEALGALSSVIPVGLAGFACMLSSMNDSAAPSLSLEGKSLWLLQSLPIDPWQVIRAKIEVQLLLTEIPMLLFCAGIATLPLSVPDKILCILFSLLYPVLSALFHMWVGIKMPIFNWTNEIVPIKQSGGVAIALFGGWGYAAVLVGGAIALAKSLGAINAAMYLAAFALISLAIGVFLYRRLKTTGPEIFRTL